MLIPLKADVKPGKGGKDLALADGPVGSLAGDNDSAIVRYKNAEPKKVATGQAVAVTIEGLSHAGTYEGKVDLVDDAEGKIGEVTIKATVSDEWWWPLIAIALGTLAALGLLRYSGSARTTFNLRLRRWQALAAVDDAAEKFKKAATGKRWAGLNIAKDQGHRRRHQKAIDDASSLVHATGCGEGRGRPRLGSQR